MFGTNQVARRVHSVLFYVNTDFPNANLTVIANATPWQIWKINSPTWLDNCIFWHLYSSWRIFQVSTQAGCKLSARHLSKEPLSYYHFLHQMPWVCQLVLNYGKLYCDLCLPSIGSTSFKLASFTWSFIAANEQKDSQLSQLNLNKDVLMQEQGSSSQLLLYL